MTATEFLRFDFDDRKAELDRGIVRVLDGVTVRHADVPGNLLVWLGNRLRGTGWSVFTTSLR